MDQHLRAPDQGVALVSISHWGHEASLIWEIAERFE